MTERPERDEFVTNKSGRTFVFHQKSGIRRRLVRIPGLRDPQMEINDLHEIKEPNQALLTSSGIPFIPTGKAGFRADPIRRLPAPAL